VKDFKTKKFSVIDLEETICYERFDYFTSSIRLNTSLKYLNLESLLQNNMIDSESIGDNEFDLLKSIEKLSQSTFKNSANYDSKNFLYEFSYIINKDFKLRNYHTFIYYTLASNINNDFNDSNTYLNFTFSDLKFETINIFINNNRDDKIYYKNNVNLKQNQKRNSNENLSYEFIVINTSQNNLENFFSYRLLTKKSNSLFHNQLLVNSLSFSNNLILPQEADLSNYCFYFFQHLNEDLYIEKNELLNKYNDHEVYFNFSNFIDQEVSADFADQNFLSFLVCPNKDEDLLDNLNYPFHFRYQPANEKLDYNLVRMISPYITIIKRGESSLKEMNKRQLLMNFAFNNKEGNEESDFLEELKGKYTIRNHFYNYLLNNKNYSQNNGNKEDHGESVFDHNVPVGRTNHIIFYSIVTSVISILGFTLILIELLKSKMFKLNKY